MKFLLLMLFAFTAFGGIQKGKVVHDRISFDFSTTHSSATSATAVSLASYPAGMVIKDAWLVVSEPVSPSAMAIEVGFTSDTDGIFGSLTGSNTTSGTVIHAAGQSSALLWDNTNDHYIPYRVIEAASDGDLQINFDDDPTQGKFEIYMELVRPVQDAQ